ncbi:MAG: glycoside hydrolase family 19 protein [Desulfobacterales bacterium]|nr:glycoside hydrolase family 19 protein [Desulfobacterales bacterium]
MDITKKLLTNLGVSDANASKYTNTLDDLFEEYAINTKLRAAHFLAQVLHESSRMARVEENLNYSKTGLLKVFRKYFTEAQATEYARKPVQIANRVYANRNGNGDETSGDGWNYRGRGLIQLTGKTNYHNFSQWLGEDVVSDPDKVAKDYPVHSAIYYWAKNDLNALADQDNINTITKRINGGYNGLQDRVELLEIVKTALPEDDNATFSDPPGIQAARPLGILLSEHPQLKTYQDLINFFYRMSDRSFPGATRMAKRYGLDMDLLVRDRSAVVERLLFDPEAPSVPYRPGEITSHPTPPGDADLHSAKTRSIKILVDLALGEVGTREVGGNNMGEEIVEYQRASWLNPGPWPWCAAFTCWILREWWEDAETRAVLGIPTLEKAEKIRCKDASAFGWEKWANKHGYQILPETELAKAGDFVVFDFSHIGLVVADQVNHQEDIQTVEGNTNGRGERDSTSGDGVWRKKRNPSLTKSYIRILA